MEKFQHHETDIEGMKEIIFKKWELYKKFE